MLLLRRVIIAIEAGFAGEICLKERKSMYELGFNRQGKDGMSALLGRNGNLNLLEKKFAFYREFMNYSG